MRINADNFGYVTLALGGADTPDEAMSPDTADRLADNLRAAAAEARATLARRNRARATFVEDCAAAAKLAKQGKRSGAIKLLRASWNNYMRDFEGKPEQTLDLLMAKTLIEELCLAE